MDTKKLTIICIAIIAIVLIAVGAFAFTSLNAKEDSKIKITSEKSLYKGDSLTVKLTGLNKTPILNGTINVTIKNKKGKVKLNKTVKSNSKGIAKLKLKLKKGKYNVNATFEGNDDYAGNGTSQKLTIKEKVKKAETASSYNSYNTKPVYDGHTYAYKDGVGGVYSTSGEFFIDPTQDHSYETF